jgi:selenocysteine-specific elongation factor
VVEAGGVLFTAAAVDSAARMVAGLLARQPTGVTVAEVRDGLGSSRRFVLALLNHLDATGITRRRGDVRIGGPRLPPA